MRIAVARFVIAALMLLTPGAAAADDLIGSYGAYIGIDDLYNSNGKRLTEPWQILRQDRANYHRFGIRHSGDEWDPFFADANNRAAMEQMVMRGRIDPVARRLLVQGDAWVYVRIFGRGGVGRSVQVDVER